MLKRYICSWLRIFGVCALLLDGAAGRLGADTTVISVDAAGASARGASRHARVTADGAAVVFESTAINLHSFDTDPAADIYGYSIATGAIDLLSLGTTGGGGGDGDSRFPSASDGLSEVAFESDATNLAADDANGVTDVYLRTDARGGPVVTLVSRNALGRPGNGASGRPEVAAAGGFIVFESAASNLVRGSENDPAGGPVRIHHHDTGSGETFRIEADGEAPDGDSSHPHVSRDGQRVVFQSSASNFVLGDRNGVTDIFLFNVETRTTTRTNLASGDRELIEPSTNPRISGDGRFVAFETADAALDPRDRNGVQDVFLRDLVTGKTKRVSLGEAGLGAPLPSNLDDVSEDGRFVVFSTVASMVADDTNGVSDVYVRDCLLGRTLLVSSPDGVIGGGDGPSQNGSVGRAGTILAFDTAATNFLPRGVDGNGANDVVLVTAFPVAPIIDLGPSSHLLYATTDGKVRQIDLAGGVTPGVETDLSDTLNGMAVDEHNQAWILDGSTVRRHGSESLLGVGSPLTLAVGQNAFFGMVAAGGFCWIAADNGVHRVASDGEIVTLPLTRAVATVALALDPLKHVWVSVGRTDSHTLIKLTRNLDLLRQFERRFPQPGPAPFHLVASDAEGNIFLRSADEIAKHSPSGVAIWRAPLPNGDGLAVDGRGNAYTVSDGMLKGLDGAGAEFLSAAVAPAGRVLSVDLVIDGAGNIWALIAGEMDLFRVTPSGDVAAFDGVGNDFLADLNAGDTSGFVAANVAAQFADSDRDEFLNREETAAVFNPFDPTDPGKKSRLPSVVTLAAELDREVGQRAVRLNWTSLRSYNEFYVFRNGRLLDGAPFPFAAAANGIVDPSAPGGLNNYRVIAQGAGAPMAPAGGGGGFSEEDIPDPKTEVVEDWVSVGEAELIRTTAPDILVEPLAVTIHPLANSQERFLVATGEGTLVSLDEDLELLDEVPLPAELTQAGEVRGMEMVEGPLPGETTLYVLVSSGQLFERQGALPFTELVAVSNTLQGQENSGFSGLAFRDDIFIVMAGPDLECLIGVRPPGDLAFHSGLGETVGDTVQSVGVGLLAPDNALLIGIGAEVEVDEVVRLDADPDLPALTLASSVSLLGIGSLDICDVEHDPDLGLVVCDRAGDRVCLLDATFPEPPTISAISPERGPWDAPAALTISGTGFGDVLEDVTVRRDGVEYPPAAVSDTSISVELPALGEAAAVAISVHNSDGVAAVDPGYVYGFRRGDANNDGLIGISDAVFVLLSKFVNKNLVPPCDDAADVDDNGAIQMTDAVFLLAKLYQQGPPPPPPFSMPGVDPTADALGCP